MKILIIKLGALGDVIMATAFIERLQASHANDTLWLLTAPEYAPIFGHWPGLNIHVSPRRGLLATLRTLAWIRGHGFDRIYDLQSNDRSALLCAFSGVAVRIGNHPRFPYTLHPPTPHVSQSHIFPRMNEVLAAAGIPPAEEKPVLFCGERERQQVDDYLRDWRLTPREFVVMHAGASPRWPAKRWPHYRELALALQARGLKTVWLGAGSDAAINAELANTVGIDATDRLSIGALAELGRHARFTVTNDSGPMHILSAAGIPVYGLFGPTDWRRSHALGQRDRVLVNANPCPACQREDKATAADHTCLSGITVEEVLSRLRRDGMLD
jgi:ADP-heptose:LPS heptosyltransferase